MTVSIYRFSSSRKITRAFALFFLSPQNFNARLELPALAGYKQWVFFFFRSRGALPVFVVKLLLYRSLDFKLSKIFEFHVDL